MPDVGFQACNAVCICSAPTGAVPDHANEPRRFQFIELEIVYRREYEIEIARADHLHVTVFLAQSRLASFQRGPWENRGKLEGHECVGRIILLPLFKIYPAGQVGGEIARFIRSKREAGPLASREITKFLSNGLEKFLSRYVLWAGEVHPVIIDVDAPDANRRVLNLYETSCFRRKNQLI